MLAEKWIVLLDHSKGALHVFDTLHRMGFKVLFIGNDLDCSAKADCVIPLDPIKDIEKVISEYSEMIKNLSPVRFLSFLEKCKFVERRMNLEFGLEANSLQSIEISRSKKKFRALQTKLNLATPIMFELTEQSVPTFFPVICKPNNGFASGGVSIVHNRSELSAAVSLIKRINTFGLSFEKNEEVGVLCEEFICGEEFAVEAIYSNGKVVPVLFCSRQFRFKNDVVDYYYGSSERLEQRFKAEVEGLLTIVLNGMNCKDGPIHAEFIYSDSTKKLFCIELGLRVGFAGNLGRLCSWAKDIPYLEMAIRSTLNQLTDEELLILEQAKYKKFVASLTLHPNEDGIVKNIVGVDDLKKDSNVLDMHLNFKQGDFFLKHPRGMDYFGEIVLQGKSEADLIDSVLPRVERLFKVEF